MKAVILAGGKGTRLNKISKEIPKPMIKIGQWPVLEHQIRFLKENNIKDIIILTGHLAEVIENYFQNGKKWGVKITCIRSNPSIGPADRIKLIENKLNRDFIILYGDVMLDMDIEKFIKFHKNKKSACTLVIHPNDHPHDSDLVEIDNNHRITAFHSKPHKEGEYLKNLDNACVYLMSPKILRRIKSKKGVELDFGKHVFPKIYRQEKLFGYNTPEYIKDMGTPDRLKQVTKDYLNGKIKKLNLKNKRKTIFLDRDGTINYDPGNLSRIDDFKLLPKTAQAIKLINSSEYLACVVTNQPMIAKGLLTLKKLDEIHKKMDTLLGQQGAKIDNLYFCPHHPDKGYLGENRKYTIQCNCRKPQIGMIKQATQDFNVDLKQSWIIGDSEKDILAGLNAGLKIILVKKNQKRFDQLRIKSKKTNDLYSAIKYIIK